MSRVLGDLAETPGANTFDFVADFDIGKNVRLNEGLVLEEVSIQMIFTHSGGCQLTSSSCHF